MQLTLNQIQGKQKNETKKSKSDDLINAEKNSIFFYLREKIIDFIRDYSLFLSESKYKVKYGRFLKMLTSKQMLQILPIILA